MCSRDCRRSARGVGKRGGGGGGGVRRPTVITAIKITTTTTTTVIIITTILSVRVQSPRAETGEGEPEMCSRIGFRADRSAAGAYGNKKAVVFFPKRRFIVGKPTATVTRARAPDESVIARTLLIVWRGGVKVERTPPTRTRGIFPHYSRRLLCCPTNGNAFSLRFRPKSVRKTRFRGFFF